jgi:hypothetical protein
MIHLTVNPPGRTRNVTRSYPNRHNTLAQEHAGPADYVHSYSRGWETVVGAQIVRLFALIDPRGPAAGAWS